LTKYSLLAAV